MKLAGDTIPAQISVTADEADEFASAALIDVQAGHTAYTHAPASENDYDLDFFRLDLDVGLHTITVRPDVRLVFNVPEDIIQYYTPGTGNHPGVVAESEVVIRYVQIYERVIVDGVVQYWPLDNNDEGYGYHDGIDTVIAEYANYSGDLIIGYYSDYERVTFQANAAYVEMIGNVRYEHTGEYYLAVQTDDATHGYYASSVNVTEPLTDRYLISLGEGDQREAVWGAEWLDRYDYNTGARLNVPAGLRVADTSVTEGDGGDVTELVFTVTLSKASDLPVTVKYATQPVTATDGTGANTDFVPTTGTLTFEPGQTSLQVRVQVRGDSLSEAHETLQLILSDASNAEIRRGTAIGTIVEDDGISVTGRNSIEPVTVGSTQATFEIRLSEPAAGEISVSYKVEGGSAIDGQDYIGATGRVTFSAGQQVKYVTVDVLKDSVTEADETFSLVLFAPEGAQIVQDRFTSTIVDPNHTLSAPPAPLPSVSQLPEEDSFGPRTSIDGSAENSHFETPGYAFDEATQRYINSATSELIPEIPAGRRSIFSVISDAVQDVVADELVERAVTNPFARSAVDMIRRVQEVRDFLNTSFDQRLDNLGALLDLSLDGATADEAQTQFERLNNDLLTTETEANRIFGTQTWGYIADGIRSWTRRSDISFEVDFDTRLVKAVLTAETGHRDIFTGSSGADIVFLADQDDVAWGGRGNDELHGQSGNDRLAGSFGDDRLFGGDGVDHLFGGEGTDLLDGGSAGDHMVGGSGADTYIVDHSGDVVSENGTEIDEVRSTVNFTLGAGLENLTLLGSAVNGTGNASANLLIGNAVANILVGGAGNDRLDGGAGVDRLDGGDGNDVYVVDNASDLVIEIAGNGTDLVLSSVTLALSTQVENLTLTGFVAIDGVGNELDNQITGNAGDNVLDGGVGSDSLMGGAGNDSYVVDSASDTVTENADQGLDVVRSSISWTLGSNLESLLLTGSNAINGTGNDANNTLLGNAGANRITGGGGHDYIDGGAGADALVGGLGDDLLIVSDAGDTTSDGTISGGLDVVRSSVTHRIGAGIDDLVLIGTDGLNGYGNGLDNTITGNSGANLLDGGAGSDAMAGGAGDDTYVVDAVGDRVREATGGGFDTVRSNVSWILGNEVEDLVLTGTAHINGNGNALANSLTGNAGNNQLDGRGGADLMQGGGGSDTYLVDNAGDRVVEGATTGTDRVRSNLSYVLPSNVEELFLVGAALNGSGNTGANRIVGNTLDNLLDGGAGADTLQGGAGNDTYIIDNVGDRVLESLNSGFDTVRSSVSMTLHAGVEQLILTGSAALNGSGNSLANSLTGNAANNTLDGRTGADTMSGGQGNDIYIVDNAGDTLVESLDAGTDAVRSSVSFTLGANIENLTLTGSGAINGTGNHLNNSIVGNAAANLLDGGQGADRLSGGGGDDIYVVDNLGDQVIEAAGGGTDSIRTPFTTTLGAEIEWLFLTGTSSVNGYGNAARNRLNGNSGDNQLFGYAGGDNLHGGAGADTLVGGTGDDIYSMDSSDTVVELIGEGWDTVYIDASFTLSAALENLTLIGSGSFSATGNDLSNILRGNEASNIITGLGGDDSIDGGAGDDTMIGGSGWDRYTVDASGDTIVELADEGHDLVTATAGYSLSANIEDLTLAGTAGISGTGNAQNNVITGNEGANALNGGGGNDILIGLGGADTLAGGTGDDLYRVDALDTISELVGQGFDTVESGVTHTLSAWVEQLILQGSAIGGTGNESNNIIIGNAADNQLSGGLGDDELQGGSGADAMNGGAGNDIFHVDQIGDSIIDASGDDLVRSAISFTLASGLEHLELLGSANLNGTGNFANNFLTGNSGANILEGGDGNDTLNGAGGADRLVGGRGDDILFIDDVGDVLVEETFGGGTDEVRSAINHTLQSNFENLTLLGTAASGTGNAVANIIVGNGAANFLSGLDGEDKLDGGGGNDELHGGVGADHLDGGSGADRLVGGDGNDSYFIDNAGDVIVEVAGEGLDIATVSVSYILPSGVDYLTLGGDLAINGTGNSASNRIEGNSADNVIAGAGGSDQLFGGLGNDTYLFAPGDMGTVYDSGGTDTIISTMNQYYLDPAAGVEFLVLSTGAWLGAGDRFNNTITGNEIGNDIYGNGGADILIGGGGDDYLIASIEGADTAGDYHDGGAGNDMLVGGAGNDEFHGGTGRDTIYGKGGADRFFFDVPLIAANWDTIMEGIQADDQLVLDRTVFGALGAGTTLSPDAFVTGTAALDANDRIIFNPTSGALFYDADGFGGAAQVQFALLSGVTSLSATAFSIVD